MKLESLNKNSKLIEIIKLINFYKGMIESYECQLNILEDNRKKLIKLKNDTEKSLEKTVQQQNQIKTINQSIEEKQSNEKLHKEREKILNQITINILQCKDNKETHPINMDYMKQLGKYKNIKQLRTDLILHINNLSEHDNINGRTISKKDIEYLKKKIRSKHL